MSGNQNTINALIELGKFLSQFSRKDILKKDNILHNDLFFDGFKHQIKIAQENNSWFTNHNILYAFESWSNSLILSSFNYWLSKYNFKDIEPKKIAIIMAGNIPLVGFHDFISVLISGHNLIVKQSSNDKHLLPLISKYLEHVNPELKHKVEFTEDKLEHFDAVIATGSSNTAKYFKYYFKDKPSIIRKNRNSVAILNGKETHEQLKSLSEDIFRYYGLGCRNVSKLFVPENFDFNPFFEAIYDWHPIINEAKYANNYDYNKAVYLMSEFEMIENGFLMLKEDYSYSSPIATLFYESYKNIDSLKEKLNSESDKIQCIVSNGFSKKEIDFGKTQKPQLWDYADGIDTVDFLLKR